MNVLSKMRMAPLSIVTVPVYVKPEAAPATRSVAAIVMVSGLPDARPAAVTVQAPVIAKVYTVPP